MAATSSANIIYKTQWSNNSRQTQNIYGQQLITQTNTQQSFLTNNSYANQQKNSNKDLTESAPYYEQYEEHQFQGDCRGKDQNSSKERRSTGRSRQQQNDNISSTRITQKQIQQQHQKQQQHFQQHHQAIPYFEYTEVFVWGDDNFGQLGLYHQKQKQIKNGKKEQKLYQVPKTCSFNIIIKQIACGANHSAILTNQGHLYMMGSNSEGQLGIGEMSGQFPTRESAGAPCLVELLKDIKVIQVICGANYTFAIATDGNIDRESTQNLIRESVYAWGDNSNGQLGISSIQQKQDYPIKVEFFQKAEICINSISCQSTHTLFVSDLGKVYSCGQSKYGALGIIYDDYNESLLVRTPTQITELDDIVIVQASAGLNHSLFLSQGGEVFSCGLNSTYQLGLGGGSKIQKGQQEQQIVQVEVPTKILQLQSHTVIKIAANQYSACITSYGELFLWGSGVFGEYKIPQKILTISNKVIDVSIGGTMGTALDSKGLVWSWGTNKRGELGVGDADQRIHPYPILSLKGKVVSQIQCGSQFIIALGQTIRKEMPSLNLSGGIDQNIVGSKNTKQQKEDGANYTLGEEGKGKGSFGATNDSHSFTYNLKQQKKQSQQRESKNSRRGGDLQRSNSSKKQKKNKSVKQKRKRNSSLGNIMMSNHKRQQSNASNSSIHKAPTSDNGKTFKYSPQRKGIPIGSLGMMMMDQQSKGSNKGLKRSSKSALPKGGCVGNQNETKISSRKISKNRIKLKKPTADIEQSYGGGGRIGMVQSNFALSSNDQSLACMIQAKQYSQLQLLKQNQEQHYNGMSSLNDVGVFGQEQLRQLEDRQEIQMIHSPSGFGSSGITNIKGKIEKKSNQQERLLNLDITNAMSNSNIQEQDNEGKRLQQSASRTNKEKLIKDLQQEIKFLKNEQEILKKDNKNQRNQIEQLEKHLEKQRQSSQFNQEVANLQSEMKKKEQKIHQLKKKKREHISIKEQVITQLNQVSEEKEEIALQLEEQNRRVNEQDEQIKEQQKQIEQYEQRMKNSEQEIEEFQREILSLGQQSQEVEKGLLEKLQEVTEKYRQLLKDKDEIMEEKTVNGQKYMSMDKKLKDSEMYANILEKENLFLREEIEKARFYKDKEEYGKFIGGLTQLKKKGSFTNSNGGGALTSSNLTNNSNNSINISPIGNYKNNSNNISTTIQQPQIINESLKKQQRSVYQYQKENEQQYSKTLESSNSKYNHQQVYENRKSLNEVNVSQSFKTPLKEMKNQMNDIKEQLRMSGVGENFQKKRDSQSSMTIDAQESSVKQDSDLKKSYNQRLLKSIEKKTMKENISNPPSYQNQYKELLLEVKNSRLN